MCNEMSHDRSITRNAVTWKEKFSTHPQKLESVFGSLKNARRMFQIIRKRPPTLVPVRCLYFTNINTQVYVGNFLCGVITYEGGKSVFSVDCGGVSGDFVKIVQSYHNILTLCEVVVRGAPGQFQLENEL